MVITFLTNDSMGFQIFTVLNFWVFTPCSQGLFQHFQEIYCFHLQGWLILVQVDVDVIWTEQTTRELVRAETCMKFCHTCDCVTGTS